MNSNKDYVDSIGYWHKYDDIDRNFIPIRNNRISFINVKDAEAFSLLIYKNKYN